MASPDPAASPAPDEPAVPDLEQRPSSSDPGRGAQPTHRDSAEEPGPVESEDDIPTEDAPDE
ncbi:hypothetical protein [Ideonella sp. YS5]|uniref:hypothetical protein n=1 Tax=Ideonella sp. YS5 TaxID=3453714 RepID=UPI003EEC4D45